LPAVLIALASVTDSLVTLATHIIRDVGLVGVAIMTLTSGVIGVPGSEPTMLFAGFDVYQGNLSLFWIIVFGVLGDMIGASIAYGIGYWGREELVERHGNKLHISKSRLDRAHRWFERFGAPMIVVSRCIPFARAAFPYAAGVARMGYGRFVAFATIGSIVWISALAVLGNAVGSSWQSWRRNLEYVDYVAAALLLAVIAYMIVRIARNRRGDPTAVA
jgi:membrane protein DedA with SNARE-associated domain